MIKRHSFFFLLLIIIGCSASMDSNESKTEAVEQVELNDTIPDLRPLFSNSEIKVGAENTTAYLNLIEGKKVGVVANQSSQIGKKHLVDSLLRLNIDILRVFSPEHGFRGDADAGEKVNDQKDPKTGLEIISLYGKNKKPYINQLEGIEVMLFDLQDVGLRFYTYISTLHYVMEACAENGIKLIILDRPNPNGHYVDGPILNPKFQSFVGMHEVPVVHGMTIGEYGLMVNAEGWLANQVKCDLKVVKCLGYDHTKFYELPIAPSPNLPNMTAVYLYPELCFFEGTVVSVGRGTDYPFQVIGHPKFPKDSVTFSFTPSPNRGAKSPKLNGEICFGKDLHDSEIRQLQTKDKLDLTNLYTFYRALDMEKSFFLSNNFIDLLYGSDALRLSVLKGETFDSLRSNWQEDLSTFKKKRKTYLLYSDFEE